MAITAPSLISKTARAKLKPRKQAYAKPIQRGLSLLYYRGLQQGTWSVRVFTGRSAGKSPYREVALGLADDAIEPDGVRVLTYNDAVMQAVEKAQALATGIRNAGPYTVQHAVSDYVTWAEAHRKSAKDIKARLERHVLPTFGARRVSALTHAEIEEWHQSLAKVGRYDRPKRTATERKRRQVTDTRARKVSANRELSYFKAVLNRAFKLGHVRADDAWRRVRGFEEVEQPRIRFLSLAEAGRLINACHESDFRDLVQGALLTGCRYGELGRLKVHDYDPDRGSIFIEQAKAGKARHVPLSAEGVSLFESLSAGKLPGDYIFVKANGRPWGANDNVPRMKAACARAKIPGFTFHQLRHTYASQLAMAGVSMKVISENLGHYDTAITEKHYAHLTEDVRREAVQRLPSFGIKVEEVVRRVR